MPEVIQKLYTPTMLVGEVKTFTVKGSFFSTTNVYLTGSPYALQTTLYAPFSASPSLSGTYHSFRGVKLPLSAYIIDNNSITFTAPSASLPGHIDVVVENEAGYGPLTKYVVKNIIGNPYKPGTYEYNNYVPFVPPWARGIKVIPVPNVC